MWRWFQKNEKSWNSREDEKLNVISKVHSLNLRTVSVPDKELEQQSFLVIYSKRRLLEICSKQEVKNNIERVYNLIEYLWREREKVRVLQDKRLVSKMFL